MSDAKPHSRRRLGHALLVVASLLLAACGGGSGGSGEATGQPLDTPAEPAPTPANQAPVPVISSPVEGLTFRAGTSIGFEGSAQDAEDGALSASQLSWWVDLHHDTHTHPLQLETQGGQGTVSIPTRGETSDNIWYRFHLRATDSAGLSSEVSRDVLPQKARITLATVPPGLQLTLDGQPVTTPLTVTGVSGIERDLAAPAQNMGGRRYEFRQWSDAGAGTHTISTPLADTTYTASFTDVDAAVDRPPSVTLTAADTGRIGTPISLVASASDDVAVQRVEFFDGSVRLGQDTSAPYAFDWTPDHRRSAQPHGTRLRQRRTLHHQRRRGRPGQPCLVHRQPAAQHHAHGTRQSRRRPGQHAAAEPRRAGAGRHGKRQRGRHPGGVPARRCFRRHARHQRALPGQRRHAGLCVGAAHRARPCARCRRQCLGLGGGDGALRRRTRFAAGFHQERKLDLGPVERLDVRAGTPTGASSSPSKAEACAW